MSKAIGINFQDEQERKIKQYAKDKGISLSAAVNEMIMTFENDDISEGYINVLKDQNKTQIQKNIIDTLKILEQKKLGININQIARVLNYGKKNEKLSEQTFQHIYNAILNIMNKYCGSNSILNENKVMLSFYISLKEQRLKTKVDFITSKFYVDCCNQYKIKPLPKPNNEKGIKSIVYNCEKETNNITILGYRPPNFSLVDVSKDYAESLNHFNLSKEINRAFSDFVIENVREKGVEYIDSIINSEHK